MADNSTATATPTSTPTTAPTTTPETTGSFVPSDHASFGPSNPTEDVARSVLAELEQDSQEGNAEAAAESTADPTVASEAKPATPEPEAKEPAGDDDPLKDLGLKPRVDGKENRIPESRVRELVARKVQRATEQAQAQIAELTSKVQTYEPQFEKVRAAEDLMTRDPAKFLYGLAQAHPLYAQILGPLFDHSSSSTTASAGRHDNEMPQPDYDLGNGQFTYSEQGLAKRMAWERQQAVREAEARVVQRFEPMLRRQQAEEHLAAMAPVVQQQVQEASTWPMFLESQPEILAALRADQRLSLEGAYRKVVFPKLQANEQSMRQKLLAEMKQQPVSTSTTAGATTSRAAKGGPQTTEDIARKILAG